MRNKLLATAALLIGAVVLPAAAGAQSYHRDCYWTGSSWGYKHGGKVLVCRPHRPSGSGWYWHSEGGKHGWHHKRHGWHHKY